MWVYRLILYAVVGIYLAIYLEKEKALLQQEDPMLLCASNLTTKEVGRFAVAQYRRHNKYPSKKQSAKLILTILLISGNVAVNRGSTNIKYPCCECARVVKFGLSIACDQCNILYHQECAVMSSTIFECYKNATIEMQWIYIRCGLPNISASLFDSSMSSINSSLNLDEDMLRVKSKSLRVVTVNFQSIYNKKDELSSFLIENDIDIVLGSETHLSPSINNTEIPPPPMYTCYRRDPADGWGGVIIIIKKSLTVEEIKINKECGMVAIKVETYQKIVIFASCYRPPKSTNNELLFEEIKRLASMHRKNPMWIGGEFNLPDID